MDLDFRYPKMPLTETAVRKAKVDPSRPQKLSDARSLYLLITKKASKCWRYKYRLAGKEKLLSLGTYPDELETTDDLHKKTPAGRTAGVVGRTTCRRHLLPGSVATITSKGAQAQCEQP